MTSELRRALEPFLAVWRDTAAVAALPNAPPQTKHHHDHPELCRVSGLALGTDMTLGDFRTLYEAAAGTAARPDHPFLELLSAAFNISTTAEPATVAGEMHTAAALDAAGALLACAAAGKDAARGVLVAARLFAEVYAQSDPDRYMAGEIAAGWSGDRFEFDRQVQP